MSDDAVWIVYCTIVGAGVILAGVTALWDRWRR